MENINIIEQDQKATDTFLDDARSGKVTSSFQKENANAIRSFLMAQKAKYADAVIRAKRLRAESPEYLEHVQSMDDVQTALANLASQKNALAEAQQSFMVDYESGSVSNSILAETGVNFPARVFRGEAKLQIDDSGNMLFDIDGRKESISNIVNYPTKDFKTAENILKLANQVYKSGTSLDNIKKEMLGSNIKQMLLKGGRNTILSLWTDDLVTGMNVNNLPKDLLKPEKSKELFDFTYNTLINSMDQVALAGKSEKDKKAAEAKARRDANKSTSSSSSSTNPAQEQGTSKYVEEAANDAAIAAKKKMEEKKTSQMDWKYKNKKGKAFRGKDGKMYFIAEGSKGAILLPGQ